MLRDVGQPQLPTPVALFDARVHVLRVPIFSGGVVEACLGSAWDPCLVWAPPLGTRMRKVRWSPPAVSSLCYRAYTLEVTKVGFAPHGSTTGS